MAKIRAKASSKKKAQKKTAIPPKALPVTLLSGFLGSGKTTLLQHILRSEHGLRIAVVVNDIGAINVDAALIKQTHHLTKTNEKVIALQNGCICCTLRGDLLEELVRLAQLQQFDYIIIESSGISEPEQVAETFDSRLAEQMGAMGALEGVAGLDDDMLKVLNQLKEAGGLEKFARLDTTVTVIDAFTMLHDFDTGDLISSRRNDVTPEDERTVSDLMVDQIEFADVIILNKVDMIDSETKPQLLSLIQKLNHRAKILESSYGKIDVKEIVNTGLFNLQVAQSGYGWLQDLHAMTVRETVPSPSASPKKDGAATKVDEDYAMLESEDLCPPSNEVILENKRKNPTLGRLFRSKGEFFLATRPNRAGDWSQAGAMLTMTGGRPWFCTLPPEEYTTGDEEVDGLVRHDIKMGGEWGDRRQELVFIGERLDNQALEAMLDECLLTDSEYTKWEKTMRNAKLGDSEKLDVLEELFEDGFPDWPGDDEEDHEGHDHAHPTNLRSIKNYKKQEA
ncbi:hypothetical protein AUP68_16004 [Ilyonectria robusta]